MSRPSDKMADHVAEGPPTPVSEFRPENEFKLCPACAKLNLRARDFIVTQIPDASHGHDLPIPGRLFQGSTQRLSNRRQIMANHKSCPLCSLIVRSLAMTSTNADMDDNDMLSVKWEIDGRDEQPSDGSRNLYNGRDDSDAPRKLRPLTRRLRLTWGTPRPDDTYLMLVAPNTYHRANHDLAGNWDAKALFLGRRIDTGKSNEVLMLSWLRSCRRHHGFRCYPTKEEHSKMLKVAESSWFAVIDVYDMCLKSLPTIKNSQADHEPYAILSYVWGDKYGRATSSYTSTRANVLFHQSPGALEDRWAALPETVRNAIVLTKSLGLRYVWVDRLCITQDSPRSCRLNINEMDTIYSNALFTICAADGADSGVGLRALLPKQRQQTKQLIQQCGPVNLMATQLAECVIKKSVWNTRAWTFQERMLSKRSFVFCQGRVYFQCRQSTMAEDIVAEPRGGGWSLELAQSPHQILHHLQKRPIAVYMDCVSLYSKRELSNSEDILSAFNGIENTLVRALNAPLVYGLPTSHFDLALLWHPTKVVKRRLAGQGPDKINLPFPSWAWCGWQFSKEERNKDATIEYSNSMLEGCLDSVRGFLIHRTWIQYFIRDDQGELRPVWNSLPNPTKIENRWRGYGSEPPRHQAQETGRNKPELYHENTVVMTQRLAPKMVSQKTSFAPRAPQSACGSQDTFHFGDGEYSRSKELIVQRTSLDGQGQRTWEHGSDAGESENSVQRDAEDYYDGLEDHQMDSQAVFNNHDQPARILVQHRNNQQFNRIYADSPYCVRMADPNRRPTPETPDQPVLQFWTRTARLFLHPAEPRPRDATVLQRFDILDFAGDWCGSICLDPDCELLRDWEEMNEFGQPRRYEFIALSEAKNFTLDECKTWTFYSPNNRDQSEWELYHCLLVEEYEQVMYRVGLGKVFKSAFKESDGDNWKEIILG